MKKKVFVLTVSKEFQSTHPKKGQPTEFVDKIICGSKIHTIRANYDLWKKRIDLVNEGKAILSLRYWSGKPYNSKQYEFMILTKVGIQKLQWKLFKGWYIDDKSTFPGLEFEIAKNDGLSYQDFYDWFFPWPTDPCAIIHFTELRYKGI